MGSRTKQEDGDFQEKLLQIGNELGGVEVHRAKFLCRDILGERELEEVKCGIDLFTMLQEDSSLSSNNTALLIKILQILGRNDLAEQLELCISTSAEKLVPFRVSLYKVCRQVDSKQLESLKFLCKKILEKKLDKVKTCEDLLVLLENSNKISSTNTEVLEGLLKNIGKEVLCGMFTPKQPGSSPQFQPNSQTSPRHMNEDFQQLNIGEKHQEPTEIVSTSAGHTVQPGEAPSTHKTQKRAQTFQPPSTSNGERIELVSPSNVCMPHSSSCNSIYQKISTCAPPKTFSWPDLTVFRYALCFSSVKKVVPSTGEKAQPVETPSTNNVAEPLQPESLSSNDVSNEPQVSAQPTPVSGLGSINSGTNVATEFETEPVTESQCSGICEGTGNMGELVTSSASHEPSVSQGGSEDCYDMSANPRGNPYTRDLQARHYLVNSGYFIHLNDFIIPGICLIINNEKFKVEEKRTGTQVDCEKLKNLFRKFRFEVEVKRNQTAEDMKKLMETYSSKDHTAFNCFVCCILTHGELGKICGSDSATVDITDLLSCFNCSKCQSLCGKPKIFFFQACRGIPETKQVASQTDNKDKTDCHPNIVPDNADFLRGYATPSGCVAYRDEVEGAWYINKLVEMLDKYHKSEHLLDILIRVNKEVAEMSCKEKGNIYQQVPAPELTLTKKVFFH